MRPHILFVDDNPEIRVLVQQMLETSGFDVSTTDNGAEVLRLIATECFAALILDNWMPEVTGVELCRRIRKVDQSIPILICSGAVSAADRQEAALAGAQEYVCKPFVSNELIKALRSCLNQSEV